MPLDVQLHSHENQLAPTQTMRIKQQHAQSKDSSLHCRHTHLQQQLVKERVLLLPPPDPPAGAVGGLAASSDSSSTTTDECDSGLLQSATGVTHVGLLRAGAARHVIAALADGQVLMYRENGEKACKCLTAS